MTNLVILGGELAVFLLQLGNYFSRPNDPTRLRFLILTFIFAAYNAGYVLIDEFFDHSFLLLGMQITIVLGLGVGAYYYHYIVREFNITRIHQNSLKTFLISGIGSLFILFTLAYFLTNNLNTLLTFFVGILVSIVFYFAARILNYSLSENRSSKGYQQSLLLIINSLGLLCIATALFLQSFFNLHAAGIFLVNLAYLASLLAYVLFFRNQAAGENRILQNATGGNIESSLNYEFPFSLEAVLHELSTSEKSVALFMLSGLTHKEIGARLGLETNTITSYASVVYRKANITGNGKKKEFLRRYSGQYKQLELMTDETQ